MEQSSSGSVFVNRDSGQAAPLPFKRVTRGVPSSTSYDHGQHHPHKARAALGTSADSSAAGAFSAAGSSFPDGAPDAEMYMQTRRMPSEGQGQGRGWAMERPMMTPNRKRSWAPSLNSPSYEQPNFVTSAAGTTSPITSRPLRTPQGEFSFDLSHAQQNANGWGGAGDDDSFNTAKSPAAFPSSTWRLNHVQQQELERQRAIEMEEERRRQEPAAKRRRGMAGAIVETALNATLMAGAAAITAYSLWSSWGRKNEEEDEGEEQRTGDGRVAADANRPSIPGGLTSDHEPPPPYEVSRTALGRSDCHSSSCMQSLRASQDGSRAAENGTPLSPNKSQDLFSSRPRHVFISQRRRRGIVPSHRNSPRANIREIAAALHKQVEAGSPSPASEQPPAVIPPPAPEPVAPEEDDHDGEDDEVFKRFQARMQSMIAEGQAALSSKPDLEGVDVDLDDDLPSSPLITPSLSEPARLYFDNGSGASASRIPASHSMDAGSGARQHHQSLAGAASQGFDFNFQQPASVFSAPGQGSQLPKNPFAGNASSRPSALGGASRSRLPRQQPANGRATIGRSAGATAGSSLGSAPYPRNAFGGAPSNTRPRY